MCRRRAIEMQRGTSAHAFVKASFRGSGANVSAFFLWHLGITAHECTSAIARHRHPAGAPALPLEVLKRALDQAWLEYANSQINTLAEGAACGPDGCEPVSAGAEDSRES